MSLHEFDPQLSQLLEQELHRQRDGLEMIPSENFTSLNVMKAVGSVLTNKYSEGYPYMRYYGGNEFIDQIESLAIQRATSLFGVNHANVQAYSGSPANHAVVFALCKPGDTIMGLHLLYGGHLTHGWKVNFSGIYYNAKAYTTNQEGYLDYDALQTQVLQEKPKLIFVGATAYPRLLDFSILSNIAKQVDAYLVADISHIAGLVVSGAHPSPVGHADVITTTTHKTLRGPRGALILCNGEKSMPLKAPKEISRKTLPTLIDRAVFPGLQGGPHNHVTAGIAIALKEASSPEFQAYGNQIVKNAKALAHELLSLGYTLITGGTDNHLILMDVSKNQITGKEAEIALDKAGITVNKNTIPHDERPPYDPSGIRFGTPVLTTRHMNEEQMRQVAQFMHKALQHTKDEHALHAIKQEIKEFTQQFPLYPELDYIKI